VSGRTEEGQPVGRAVAPLAHVLPPELLVLATLDQPARWCALPAVEWERVVGIAGYHRLHGRFATALETVDGARSPAQVIDELVARREMAAAHYRTAILPQLEEVCDALVVCGVTPTLLKGASLITSGMIAPGERPVADLDVLVDRGDARRAQAVLADLGYDVSVSQHIRDRAWTHHYQDAPLRHPARAVPIDLHWHIQTPGHRHPFDVAELEHVSLVLPSGLAVQRFSDRDELIHLCLHFWKDRAQGRDGSLGQLWDIATAADRIAPDEWTEVGTSASRLGRGATVAACLALTNLLLGRPVPDGLPNVTSLVTDERLHSFAIRRVLAPRPEHAQLLMVTADVPYTGPRVLTRVLAYLRRGPDDGADRGGCVSWARHVGYVARLLARAARRWSDTRAEISLDRWAHDLDADQRTSRGRGPSRRAGNARRVGLGAEQRSHAPPTHGTVASPGQ
jgi:hypothetical protein